MSVFLGAIKKAEIGDLARVIKLNKSGVILAKDGKYYLVKFANGTSDFFTRKELQIID